MSSPEKVQKIIADIESTEELEFNRPLQSYGVELIPYQFLVNDLSGNCGAFFVRFILFYLGIDENQVLRWRLENKFRQYQILNFYSPGCMPDTLGFFELLKQDKGVEKIRELFSKGYFLKAALGDASHVSKSWDKTKEFDDILSQYSSLNEPYEAYVVQKKLRLRREFRVHTFCKDVIPLLTYRIPNTQYFNYHRDAEEFVASVSNRLPNQITEGTLIAWDIGLTTNGQYFIIEANFTGFHPEYRRGFQTTGYVDNHQYGAVICAWLNSYFCERYGLFIETVDPILLANYPFYKAFLYYNAIFINNDYRKAIHKQQGILFSVILYLGDVSNILTLNLVNHFLSVDLADKYYIIVHPSSFDTTSSLFRRPHTNVISEAELFTPQQYDAVIHMGYERKKKISSYHLARKLKNENYLII